MEDLNAHAYVFQLSRGLPFIAGMGSDNQAEGMSLYWTRHPSNLFLMTTL